MEVCEPIYISTFTRYQILIHVSRFFSSIEVSHLLRKRSFLSFVNKFEHLQRTCSCPPHMSTHQMKERHALGRCISHQKCLEGVLRGGYAGFMLGEVSADLVPWTTALQPLVERCRILDHVSCDSDNLLQATLSFNLKLFTCCSIRARAAWCWTFSAFREILHILRTSRLTGRSQLNIQLFFERIKGDAEFTSSKGIPINTLPHIN